MKNKVTRINIYETATKSRYNSDICKIGKERERQRRRCLGSECLRRTERRLETKETES